MLFSEVFVEAEVAYRQSRLLESAARRKSQREHRAGRPVAGRARKWWGAHVHAVR